MRHRVSTTLAGLKIRSARKQLGMTQGELARRCRISASYLNLIELNKRPVSAALLDRIAAGLSVRRATLDGEAEQRIVDELNEISVDLAVTAPGAKRKATDEFVGRYPGWAELLLDVYRAYRQRTQDVLALADRLNHDPFLGESVHRLLTKVASIRSAAEIVELGDDLAAADRARFLSIISADSHELARTAELLVDFFENSDARVRAATPTERVDALLFNAQNHFPELEAFAEERIGGKGLAPLLRRLGSKSASRDPANGHPAASALSAFDRLRSYVAQVATREIDTILDQAPMLVDAAARELAAQALHAYAAAAMLMPYDAFFEAAERHRYDLDALTRQFGVSYEQAAHRLTTLRRAGREGPRFAFMRSDASGFITKRLPLPLLPLPRYGHACPLWVVYGAFQTPGVTVRAFGELPTGEQFLFFARTIEKRPARAGFPRHLRSVMLACAGNDAHRVSAGDGIDRTAATIPLGTTCSLCPRRACAHRQQPRLTVEAGSQGL
jgi:predicted transcriptional regulator/transcriptional regulator with XRE-family HTH domain